MVLQKLLTTEQGTVIVRDGFAEVGGIVVEAAAARGLRTPEELLRGYGYEGAPDFVDVVRFELPPLASLATPPSAADLPWAPFRTGFLRAPEIVPVWLLSRTRYSYGAEYWRIHADGEQQCLSAYQGAARGWRGAQGWRPARPLVGLRARWHGSEFAADVVGEGVLLTAYSEAGPRGFEAIRPGAWSAAVPAEECEIFATVITGSVEEVPVRLLASDGTTAHVLLLTSDPGAAQRLDASMVDQGVFEAHVPVAALTGVQGVEDVVGPDHRG